MADLNYQTIQTLAKESGGPFYLFDPARFGRNLRMMSQAFESRYTPFLPAYSYKANCLPYLCRLVRQVGCWAEVVSRMEYDLALRIGQDPARIIFNGPVKSEEDIVLALDNGTLINLDCEPEAEAVIRYARSHPDRKVRIGLRINIALSDSEGVSHIQSSLKTGRFGFAPSELEAVSRKLEAADNLTIVSLHGHTSTTDRSVWCFETITRTLAEIAERHFPDSIEYLNIGGGFFGPVAWRQVPAWDDYAGAVSGVLNESDWVRTRRPVLVIEPGMAPAADTMSFIARVVSVKRIRDKTIVTVDGSAFHTKPTFHSYNPPRAVITDGTPRMDGTYDVAGSTCMEKDYLLKEIEGPVPRPGDYLRIDSVGAYTLAMSPSFIHPAPAVWALEESGPRLIRRRQTLDDVFGPCLFNE